MFRICAVESLGLVFIIFDKKFQVAGCKFQVSGFIIYTISGITDK